MIGAKLSALICLCYLGSTWGITNVALYKPATQSTFHPTYGNPQKAVDSYRHTYISQCTHTADEDDNPNRWFRVDLLASFDIEAVVLTNRGDCCGFRLANFDVYVTDSVFDPFENTSTPSDSEKCVHRDQAIGQGATTRLDCTTPVTGRYVTLVVRTNTEPLNFCEMQVLGVPNPQGATNVALSKSATQSTFHPLYGNPQKAVDNNLNTHISQCTHTADEDENPNRWFRVDLLASFVIEAVILTNRGDRLANFDVYVTDSVFDPFTSTPSDSEKCVHRDQAGGQGATTRLDCTTQITGRYVTLVVRTNIEPLNFCEMQVLGVPDPEGATNVALNKPATQSTSYLGYGNPQKAVDNNLNTHISQCTHTSGNDDNPNRWFRVDLLASFDIEAVILTNRGDCCGDRLANFDVYVTGWVFDPFTSTPSDSEKCVHRDQAIGQGATTRLDCTTPVTGRYVTLVVRTNTSALNFCEMQVMGVPNPQGATNVALYKPATQSTFSPTYGSPQIAVDNKLYTHARHCIHTASHDDNPNRWFRVDLLASFVIEAVILTNRGDCCGYRLANFDVYVTDSVFDPFTSTPSDSEKCVHRDQAIGQGATTRLDCTTLVTGRYVTLVVRNSTEALNFCEIQVMGVPDPESATNVAFNKPATQSTFHRKYGHPWKAVDNNLSTFFTQCTSTAKKDDNPNRWFRIDLLARFDIEAVILTNSYCCGYYFANFDVYVTNSVFNPFKSTPSDSEKCLHRDQRIGISATIRLDCTTPVTGRYVTLVLRSSPRPLNICEMQVLGVPDSGGCKLQSSFTLYTDSRLKKFKLAKLKGRTVEQCKQACLEYSVSDGTRCMSFSIRHTTRQTDCFLHLATMDDKPVNFLTPAKGFDYYQRDCV